MKSRISKGTIEKNITYPSLKVHTNKENESIIVLFTERNTGTIVYSERPDQLVGEYGGRDACCWIEEDFYAFNGTIELSNN